MKFILPFLIILIISSPVPAQVELSDEDKRSIEEYQKNFICPSDPKKALIAANIEMNREPSCWSFRGQELPEGSIMPVAFRREPGEHMDDTIPVFFHNDGDIFVFPRAFNRSKELLEYVSKEAYIPMRSDTHWTNFTLNNFAAKSAVKKGSHYCIKYDFKFPLSGTATQCPEEKALNTTENIYEAYNVSGNIQYVEGVFSYKNALDTMYQFAEKNGYELYSQHKAEVILNEYGDTLSPAIIWGGPGGLNAAIKLDEAQQQVDYYLIADRFRRGPKGYILVKIMPDGKINFKVFDEPIGGVKDLFEKEQMLETSAE